MSPRAGPSQARRSSFAPMAPVGSGAGSCTVPASTSISGGASSNHIVGKARLSAAFLWEHEVGDALHLLYSFLAGFYGEGFTLQVSEVHLCADIAGWELSLDDAPAFITRGHRRKTHTEGEDAEDAAEEEPFVHSSLELNMTGRRCTGYEFSKGAASLLHHLRQDQGDHRLAQGLDARGLAKQWLGWGSKSHPCRVPLQTRMSQGTRC